MNMDAMESDTTNYCNLESSLVGNPMSSLYEFEKEGFLISMDDKKIGYDNL